MRTVLYPGTFDPPTYGHVSLIRRGCQIFDRVLVAVADQTPKPPLYSQEERVELMRGALAGLDKVEVVPFTGLTVDQAAQCGCHAILRGMRAMSDFESEFQLALMNRRLNRQVETVFLITDYRWLYVSSSIIKSAACHGGNIRGLVPDNVADRLAGSFKTGAGVSCPTCPAPHPDEMAAPAVPSASNIAAPWDAPLLPQEGGEGLVRPDLTRTAVYPGTFDPVTNGHLSIIRRALKVFDHIVVAVADNAGKHPLFSLAERVRLVEEALRELKGRVTVVPYGNLTVDFAHEHGACAILRGLRATGDFEYEFQLALMNRRMRRNIETVFFMTDYRWLYVSSSVIKATASHGAPIDGLVPDNVRDVLVSLFRNNRLNRGTPCLGAPLQGYAKTEDRSCAQATNGRTEESEESEENKQGNRNKPSARDAGAMAASSSPKSPEQAS